MENNLPTTDSQSRFDALATGFKPKLPPKLALMLPFKNQIEGLLAKRASYDDIRLLLEDVKVVVSKNTIYRFCHQVIGHQSVRRRDHASAKEITPLNISPEQPSIQAALQERREQIPGPWSRRKPGPRIANFKNL
jgi:hypothetical protein